MHRFNPFGGHSDPVQLMYGRTAYFKYLELAMYRPIHFVWESIEPWLYARTSTVLISQMFYTLICSIWLPFAYSTVDVLTYSLFKLTM